MKQVKLYKGKVIINFDEERHIFSDVSGRVIPGVTSITGMIDKSRPLIFWAVGLAKNFLLGALNAGQIITAELVESACKKHSEKKKEAADIGTQIHEWASDWINKKNPVMPEDERVLNGVNAFMKWIKETKIKLSESEQIIYSKKYGYAGIKDAKGAIGKQKYLVDFKSSNGIYNEYRYQAAAYCFADEEESGDQYDGVYIVQFGKETGNFAVLMIPRNDYKKDFKAFLGALLIKQREKELSKFSY